MTHENNKHPASCETCHGEGSYPMTPEQLEGWEERFLEVGAEIEHERWNRWQAHVHAVYLRGDFDAYLPRWERQIATPYAQLSEEDKEKDREQVRPYLSFISQELERAEKKAREEELEILAVHLERQMEGYTTVTVDSVYRYIEQRGQALSPHTEPQGKPTESVEEQWCAECRKTAKNGSIIFLKDHCTKHITPQSPESKTESV